MGVRAVFSVVAVSALLIVSVPPSAQAAPKAGGPCPKAGQTVKVKKQVLTCTKRGKKLIWVKKRNVGPSQSAPTDPSTPPIQYSSDPVTAKLQRQMSELPPPNTAAQVSPMRFILEEPGDEPWRAQLEPWFTYLAQAYPDFSWQKQGFTIMPRTEAWLVQTMRDLGCGEQSIARTRRGFDEPSPVWGKGATDCNPNLGPVAVISIRLPVGNSPGLGWTSYVADEFSEVIRANRFAMNPLPMNGPVPMTYFDVGMPSWIREGVERAFHSVAQAKQTRIWIFETYDPRKTCGTEILRDYAGFATDPNGCHYVLGRAATELMLALYGWDSPQLWFSSFGSQQDPYVAFRNAYGDDYSTFEEYVRQFVRWRAYGEPMSAELLARLK